MPALSLDVFNIELNRALTPVHIKFDGVRYIHHSPAIPEEFYSVGLPEGNGAYWLRILPCKAQLEVGAVVSDRLA